MRATRLKLLEELLNENGSCDRGDCTADNRSSHDMALEPLGVLLVSKKLSFYDIIRLLAG